MNEKILVTSALPYVNNVPHMGNIIGCVLSADVFARFKRAQGHDVLYVCGTDEHGTTTETTAQKEGLTPQDVCDKYYAVHKQVYEWFNISFDIFGRTSAENHHKIVQDIFKDVKKQGYVIEQDVKQAYCPSCSKFLADRFVEGECPHCSYEHARGDQCEDCGKLLTPLELKKPTCKTCGTTPEKKTSTHLFLDLEKLQPKISKWFDKQSKEGGWTNNATTTTKAWLDKGLEPRAITRDLNWGVPVPGMKGKVFYVWFDAPIGYISITGQIDGVDWKDWWQNPAVKLYQFMAKDNIPFHTIMFPATLLATGKLWTLLHHINVTEYLQHEDGKFSKSRGTGLFGDDAMSLGIPPDVFRYYLLINRPEKSDTVFTWKDLQDKTNNELLANLGNLVNRTLSFIKNYHDGKINEFVPDEKAQNFWEWINAEEEKVTLELSRGQEKEALRRVMMIAGKANQYFQEEEPWKTRKEDPEKCVMSLAILAHIVKDLAILVEPFLPSTSERIFSQLGLEEKPWSDLGKFSVTNHEIGEPETLFSKLEDKDIEKIKEDLKKPELKPLQVRAGLLKKVEKHPDADKLFVETVLFGEEEASVVSGLVGHYTPEELEGKTALFMTNLAPAKLRGVVSEAMILAAEGDETLEVCFTDLEHGTPVLGSGSEDQMTFKEFQEHSLTVRKGKAFFNGEPFLVDGKQYELKNIQEGTIR